MSESDSVSDGLPVNSAFESFWYFVTSLGHFISEPCSKLSNITHEYCISSWVLRIWLTCTAYPHGYWGYDSLVLMIWLMGTAYPHGYWGYDSRALHILMGTEDMTHGYWGYDSRVLMIWLMGNAYPHGYCIPSWVLHTLMGTAYSLYRVDTFPTVFRRLRGMTLISGAPLPQMALVQVSVWKRGLWVK